MSVTFILVLIATGIAIGFISGMLGLGGGVIMTPVQVWLYTSNGVSTDIAVKMAFATTLAVVLPTAASGVWQHQKQDAIKWKVAIFMGIFTAIGSFAGSSIATHLPGSALKIAWGAVGLAVAIRMAAVKITDIERPTRNNPWLWFALALPIGLITGILGIGGGILVIPALVLVLGFRMKNAIATSLAIMLFTSSGAIIGYVINGESAVNLPANTIGYVFWPAWIVLTIGGIAMAQAGAYFTHQLPGKVLNYAFIIVVTGVSLEMLGAFSWIAEHI
jgi:uncharacterized protein